MRDYKAEFEALASIIVNTEWSYEEAYYALKRMSNLLSAEDFSKFKSKELEID